MTSGSVPIGSVLIPAWNEAAVIGRTLGALHTDVPGGSFEVVVACNGCTDGTEEVVRRSGHPVRLLELGPVGKAGAIRAAEQATTLLPRLYLDADTELPGASALAVLRHLAAGGVAARPPAVFNLDGCSWAVRAFYRVRAKLPSIQRELYGAGVYGLGSVARARFTTFPDVVADDLFAARIVDRAEVSIIECPPATVRVPRRIRELVTTLARIQRGNRELAARLPDLAPSTSRGSVNEVLALLRSPRRIPDIVVYVIVTVVGRALSRSTRGSWERDDTAREAALRHLMMTIVEEQPVATTTRISHMPLWILAGQAGIVIATVVGFGARQNVPPGQHFVLLVLAAGGLVLLGPVGRIRRVVVSLSFMAYLTWWLLSYFWTVNPGWWFNDTQLIVPASVLLTVIATVLPTEQFIRGILVGAYVGMGYTTFYTVTHPGPAMSHTDGAPGWSGSFGHKNALAPFMLYAIFAVLAFEQDRRKRRIALAVAFITIAMSRSTTTYIAAATLLPFAHFLRTTAAAPPEVRGTRLLVGSLVGLAVVVVSVTYMPLLLDAVGKDPTLTRRTEVWEGVFRAIELQPWTGYGIGGVWRDQTAEPTRSILAGLGFEVFHAHNGFLEILLQLGAVGLLLFAVLLSSYLRTAVQLMSNHPEWSCFAILFAAMIIVTSLSEVTTFGILLMFLGMFHAAMLRMRADELAAPRGPATARPGAP